MYDIQFQFSISGVGMSDAQNLNPRNAHIYNNARRSGNFLARNKLISYFVIIAATLLLVVFALEKSKPLRNLIPALRGEVTLANGLVITTIRNKYPIIIRKDDPFIGTQLRFSGDVFSNFSEAAEKICQSNDKIVEVGAHFGFNTIVLGKKIGPGGKIYVYEPNSTIFKCLQKSVCLNELDKNVELRNIAMGDHIGVCDIDDVMSVVRYESGELSKADVKSVACSTLDEDLRGKKISLLLIDLPGQEFHIVNHARQLIENSDDLKILLSFKDTGENGSEEQVLDYLMERGYKCYEVTSGPVFTLVTREEIMSRSEGVLLFSKGQL